MISRFRTFRLSILRGCEVEYDFTSEESGSELFQSWWLRRGVRGGEQRGEQNALKMEKRLGERSKRDRREKLIPRVAL